MTKSYPPTLDPKLASQERATQIPTAPENAPESLARLAEGLDIVLGKNRKGPLKLTRRFGAC